MKKRPFVPIYDEPGPGEGRLLLHFGAGEHLLIDGKTRIHLHSIARTGINGGQIQVVAMIIAPKEIGIKRVKS